MYNKIRARKTPPDLYADNLIKRGLITCDQVNEIRKEIIDHFKDELEKSLDFKPTINNYRDPNYKGSRSLTHKWKDMQFSQWGTEPKHTGVDKELIKEVGRASVDLPKGFNIHPKLTNEFIPKRLKDMDAGKITMPTAEMLAMATLSLEGFNTRLVG